MNQELLRRLPSVGRLMEHPTAAAWLADGKNPRPLVADCIRQVVEELRAQILNDSGGQCGSQHVAEDYVLSLAGRRLIEECLRERRRLDPVLLLTSQIFREPGAERRLLRECGLI